MKNPILAQLKNNTIPQNQPQNNPVQMLQQFADFKKQMQGKDPRQIVNNLLHSGKMSQQQFEQLKQQADVLHQFLK